MNEAGLQPVEQREREGRASVPELTVVIPTFCERDNILLIVGRIAEVLRGTAWEIIVVDDDSPDGTWAAVKSLALEDARIRCIRRIKRRGLAGACIEGMLASAADYVAVIDADMQHDHILLLQMLERLRGDEADIVVGTRYRGGDVPGLSLRRLSASRVATALVRRLLGTAISDPLSGFFMLRRSLVEAIAPRLSTHGFKILMDILASIERNVRVLELPYTFKAREHGESKLDSRVAIDFMSLMLAKTTYDVVPPQFISFASVGIIGIAVHLVALKILLSYFALQFVWAQTGATLTAMASNFLMNNALTYRDRRLSGTTAIVGFFIFSAICSVSALSNIGVASWLYSNRQTWWVAGLLGSLVGAVWNYVMSTALVWRALSGWRK